MPCSRAADRCCSRIAICLVQALGGVSALNAPWPSGPAAVRRALDAGHGDQAGGDQGALTAVPVGGCGGSGGRHAGGVRSERSFPTRVVGVASKRMRPRRYEPQRDLCRRGTRHAVPGRVRPWGRRWSSTRHRPYSRIAIARTPRRRIAPARPCGSEVPRGPDRAGGLLRALAERTPPLRYPAPALCSSSTVRSAVGRASSLASGICAPVSTERP